MEVHHHSHTERKKWTHYFWEFLTLFLAVFCGFLAEYQLEHKIEKERAKQYAISLLDDLVADTINVNEIVKMYEGVSNELDSFVSFVNTGSVKMTPGGKLYWYGNSADMSYRPAFRTTTIEQLKNSGTIRYFSIDLQKKIAQYDQYLGEMSLRQNNEPLYNIETRKYIEKIFDNEVLEKLENLIWDTSLVLKQAFMDTDFPLLTNDAVLLKEYANNCYARKRNWLNRNSGYKLAKKMATQLILVLKKEYHLE
jgi:hypothetical protein